MFGKELAEYKVEVVFRKLHKILEKNLIYIYFNVHPPLPPFPNIILSRPSLLDNLNKIKIVANLFKIFVKNFVSQPNALGAITFFS